MKTEVQIKVENGIKLYWNEITKKWVKNNFGTNCH